MGNFNFEARSNYISVYSQFFFAKKPLTKVVKASLIIYNRLHTMAYKVTEVSLLDDGLNSGENIAAVAKNVCADRRRS